MKKILFVLAFLLLPFATQAQVALVPQGGTGTTTFPLNWFVTGNSSLRLSATGTPFFQNFSFALGTGTAATTTSFFTTFFGIGADFINDITGNGLTVSGGVLNATLGTTIAPNELVGQPFTANLPLVSNAAGTSFSATGTPLYLDTVSTNSTSTNATSTNLFTTTASSTKFYYGAGLGCAQFNSVGLLTSTGSNCGSGGGGGGNSKFASTTNGIVPNGGVATRVGIGTSTDPTAMLDVYASGAMPFRVSNGTTPFSSFFEIELSGNVGVGTSTSAWPLQISSSTRPQLTLSDGSVTSDHWSFRNAGGLLYVATSSVGTLATSTVPALLINQNGNFGIGTTSAPSRLTVGISPSAGSFPAVLIGNNSIGTPSANGTYLGISAPAAFSGDLLRIQGGSSGAGGDVMTVAAGGNMTLPNGSFTAGGNVSVGAANFFNFTGRSIITSQADGSIMLQNSAGSDFTRLTLGGTTTAFPGITKITQGLVFGLGDGTNGGFFGIGTSTPKFSLMVASSTRPQIALSDGSLASSPWTLRNAGGVFYVATSSPTTFATSTKTALTIDTNGNVGINDSTPNFGLEIDSQIGGNGFFGLSTTGEGDIFIVDPVGRVGIGTTTPARNLTIASSTKPQLMLTDASLTSAPWNFRSAGGNLYIATSSPTTFATSTFSALTLNGTGIPSLSIGSTTNSSVSSMLEIFDSSQLVGSSTQLAIFQVQGSSSPAFAIDSANDNGLVRIGTTSPSGAIAHTGVLATGGKVFMSGLTSSGATQPASACFDANGQLITDSGVCIVSDPRAKNIIGSLTGALDEIKKLNPIHFTFKPEFNGSFQSNPNYNGEQVGFNAKEVQAVDPRLSLVYEKDSNEGVFPVKAGEASSVRYANMSALAIAGVKELNDKVDNLATGTKKSMEDNYQWGVIAALVLWNVYLTRRKK